MSDTINLSKDETETLIEKTCKSLADLLVSYGVITGSRVSTHSYEFLDAMMAVEKNKTPDARTFTEKCDHLKRAFSGLDTREHYADLVCLTFPKKDRAAQRDLLAAFSDVVKNEMNAAPANTLPDLSVPSYYNESEPNLKMFLRTVVRLGLLAEGDLGTTVRPAGGDKTAPEFFTHLAETSYPEQPDMSAVRKLADSCSFITIIEPRPGHSPRLHIDLSEDREARLAGLESLAYQSIDKINQIVAAQIPGESMESRGYRGSRSNTIRETL